jgi:hypothetical protein
MKTRHVFKSNPLVPFIACAILLWCSGCIGAAGRVGYRTSFKKQDVDDTQEKETLSHVYGGPVVDLSVGRKDVDDLNRNLFFNIQYSYNFAGGRSQNFSTIMPVVGFRSPESYQTLTENWPTLSSLGGFIGTGLDIGARRVAFHGSLCGGILGGLQAYACTRVSGRGWIGFDLNGGIEPPVTVREGVVGTLQGIGLLLGGGYMG